MAEGKWVIKTERIVNERTGSGKIIKKGKDSDLKDIRREKIDINGKRRWVKGSDKNGKNSEWMDGWKNGKML